MEGAEIPVAARVGKRRMKLEHRKSPAIGFTHGREVAKESQDMPPVESMETQFAFPRDESVF